MSYTGLPLLFAVPGRTLFWWVACSTPGFVALAVAAYLAGEAWSGFPYFTSMSALMLGHGGLALLVSRGNLLWTFRYALVFLLVFGTAAVWAIFDGAVKVAPFGVEFQTAENTRVLVHAGFLSLCGSLLGWVWALQRVPHPHSTPVLISPATRSLLWADGGVLAAGFSAFYLYKSGGFLLGGFTYNSRLRDLGFVFGVFNIFHFIGIAMLLLAALRPERIKPGVVLFCVATLVVGVLTGSRADFLPQLFLLLMLLFNRPVNNALERRQFLRLTTWALAFTAFLYAGYVAASLVALWRSGEGMLRAAEILFGSGDSRLFISSVYGHPMLYFETGNMMLGGLYAAIVNVREGLTGMLWGQSYFDYLRISPPAFLGLPRPLGLEWSTFIDGARMAQGGIFEVAEAYWNFGFAGCFAVSFLLSGFFGWLLRRGMFGNNYFFLTWYIVFGLHSFRSIWYQNFSYFRLFTIMLLIYLAGRLFAHWYTTDRRIIPLPSPIHGSMSL